MSEHYATTTKFSGQRASVTRNVVVKHQGEIMMGVIVAISFDGKRPIIRMLSDRSPDARHDSATGFDANFSIPYQEIQQERDIASAPDCWFWPPRV